MSALLLALLAADPACLPQASDAGVPYHDRLDAAAKDKRTPRFTSAPADARPLLTLIWLERESPAGLRPLMEQAFTWSFGGDADADQAVDEWKKQPKALQGLTGALTGPCKRDGASLTCAA